MPIHGCHTFDRRRDLFEVSDICPKSVSTAASVLNFEFGYIQFTLASAEKSDRHACVSETNRQALADSATGPSDQRGHLLVRVQVVFYRPPRNCRRGVCIQNVFRPKARAARVRQAPSLPRSSPRTVASNRPQWIYTHVGIHPYPPPVAAPRKEIPA
jgi:hypothetical protein